MNPLTRSYYSGASDAQIIYETIGTYFDKAKPWKKAKYVASLRGHLEDQEQSGALRIQDTMHWELPSYYRMVGI